MKEASPEDLVAWIRDGCYTLGVVHTVGPTGFVLSARVWCADDRWLVLDLPAPGVGFVALVASASAMNTTAEDVARRYRVHVRTMPELQDFLTPFKN